MTNASGTEMVKLMGLNAPKPGVLTDHEPHHVRSYDRWAGAIAMETGQSKGTGVTLGKA